MDQLFQGAWLCLRAGPQGGAISPETGGHSDDGSASGQRAAR
jgi:hypothetical protein